MKNILTVIMLAVIVSCKPIPRDKKCVYHYYGKNEDQPCKLYRVVSKTQNLNDQN